VHCLQLTARNTKVVTGSGDKTCKVWCLQTYTCLYTLAAHTEVRMIKFNNFTFNANPFFLLSRSGA
jgi:hypothetical protein